MCRSHQRSEDCWRDFSLERWQYFLHSQGVPHQRSRYINVVLSLHKKLPDHSIFVKRLLQLQHILGIREFARRAGASVVVFSDDDIPRLLCAKSGGAVNLFCFPAMSNFHGYKWDLSLVSRLQENPDNLILLDAGKGPNSETKSVPYSVDWLPKHRHFSLKLIFNPVSERRPLQCIASTALSIREYIS
jgi:hypothetical protein